jgi:hypothetical protein
MASQNIRILARQKTLDVSTLVEIGSDCRSLLLYHSFYESCDMKNLIRPSRSAGYAPGVTGIQSRGSEIAIPRKYPAALVTVPSLMGGRAKARS